jgi:hypothetical protein
MIETRMSWTRHVARMGEVRRAANILIENPQEKRPLGKPRNRWEDTIKMYLK